MKTTPVLAKAAGAVKSPEIRAIRNSFERISLPPSMVLSHRSFKRDAGHETGPYERRINHLGKKNERSFSGSRATPDPRAGQGSCFDPSTRERRRHRMSHRGTSVDAAWPPRAVPLRVLFRGLFAESINSNPRRLLHVEGRRASHRLRGLP